MPRQERRHLWFLLLLIPIAAFGIWTLAFWTPWDARLGKADAERALQEKVGGGPYSCKRQEKDSSLDLPDVDFYCESRGVEVRGYWIGTDGHKITDLLPAG